MADSRFFTSIGPVALQDIAKLTGAVLNGTGNRAVEGIAPLDKAGPDDISFLDNVKYIETFSASKAGACFVRAKYAERAPSGMAVLLTDDPYYAFAVTAKHFYTESAFVPGISPKAVVAESAKLGKDVRIDAGAFIGERVILGDRCWIGPNAVIYDGVEIGSDSRVGAVSSISHAVIGSRAIIHRGVHIGQDGFGFAPSRQGILKVPQLGRVIIGNDVEIGSGTCIDRGAGPDTVIGDFCKIDNLVMIAHNVELGKYVIITGQCGIAGSTQLGDGVMLGAQSGLAGHLKIGAGAKVAAQSGVMRDVPPGQTHGGTPAVPVKDWHRQTVAVMNLTKKRELADD